jgi:hypothetical protein
VEEGRASFKRKQEPAHRLSAGNIGALSTIGSFVPIDKKNDGDDKPGPTGTLSGSHSGQAPLRREQQEQLKSKRHREESETNHRHCKHSPQKTRNGGKPADHLGQIALRS